MFFYSYDTIRSFGKMSCVHVIVCLQGKLIEMESRNGRSIGLSLAWLPSNK